MMRTSIVIAVAAAALFGAGASWANPARQDAVRRYERALERACGSGEAPGPATYRLYTQARRVEPWLASPSRAYSECMQAP